MVLTKEQKLDLRNKAKAELKRLEDLKSDKDTIERIENFLLKFAICETVYKVILKKQQKDNKEHPKTSLKLIYSQIKPALSYAGLPYDEKLMKKLFSTNYKVRNRTVKSLRDALTHGLSASAIRELKDREEELHDYMDSFLNLIRNFESKEEDTNKI